MAIPVKLPVFEGPLDLLMHLIEKNKIDIYDIPIVEITDQYLEYVHQMDHEDMDVTSEFLVMAATLLDIKSRMLLPREKDEETGEEEGDPRGGPGGQPPLRNQPGGKNGILVITADKGLAGAYNQNVVKDTLALMDRSNDYKLYIVGDYGWRYFRSRGSKVCEAFEHSMNEPSLAMARDITKELLDEFDAGAFTRLYVCYTEYSGGMSPGAAMHDRLIPFDKDDFVPRGDEQAAADASTVFEYEPDVETVLARSIQSYLVGYVYSALVNSYSSEQSARMMAMDAANDNASELLASLQLEYNHLRQNAITQEITEISSGARSLRSKRG